MTVEEREFDGRSCTLGSIECGKRLRARCGSRDFHSHPAGEFDEDASIGVVIVDRLDRWAEQLDAKWDASFDERIVEEIAAVTTVMTADLAELVFVTSAEPPAGRAGEIHARILEAMAAHVTERIGD